ncbi:MLP-like protein 43 [Morella rubra]|uniref:MLP-like protein 43 n=1 Tax=Morella rubra TaxID=262757 RepID=A0A6A1UPF7_9ROSI|nr:MLP-like protein 43 [Morella rubra]KAB1200981.1 MLP-like protein 43 [Morella rubra]
MPSVVHEVNIRASPQNFYAVCSHNLSSLSNFCPNSIPYVDKFEGEWGEVGSKMSWSFAFEGYQLPHVVELRALNRSNMSVTFVVRGGYLLENYFNRFQFTIQAMQGVVRWTVQYEKRSEDQVEGTIQSLVRETYMRSALRTPGMYLSGK